jgi:hypothetical protein
MRHTLRKDNFGEAPNTQLDESLAQGIGVLAWSLLFFFLSSFFVKCLLWSETICPVG